MNVYRVMKFALLALDPKQISAMNVLRDIIMNYKQKRAIKKHLIFLLRIIFSLEQSF